MADNQSGSRNDVQVVNNPPPPKENKKRKMLIVIIVLLLLALLGVGVWYLLSEPEIDTTGGTDVINQTDQEPTNTPVPTETPEPVDRSEISIQVLNGTGVAGEAGLLQDELEGLDYEDIEVGNAEDTDYEAAEVTFDSDLSPTVVTEITERLEDFYSDVTSSTESLEDFDVIIITGEREGMARATATPEPTETTEEDEAETTPTETPSPSPTP